jgi:hypothetical protein
VEPQLSGYKSNSASWLRLSGLGFRVFYSLNA